MSSLLVNRVYRLEIKSVMLVFSTPLVNQRPANLLTGSSTPPSPAPLPCVNKYRGFMYSYSVQRGGGDGGPKTDKHLPPSTFTGHFGAPYRYLVHAVPYWVPGI